MRRMLRLTVVFFLCLFSKAYAQNSTDYTGKITDAENKPIDAASIMIQGTKKGTLTNTAGEFKLSAPKGSTIVITALNFETQQIKLGDATTIPITLVEKKKDGDEVIVTALGIKRSRNLLPYAAETIGGNEVSKTRNANFINGMSGKIAGLEIRQGNNVGSSTNVVLRGMKSITRSNQAMFVIDGVPIDNNITNTANQQRGAGGYDYGNTAADINPDDIESITVLKDAAATVLYGSRAGNGVILVNTKKGKKAPTQVVVNAGLTMGKMDHKTFLKYQKEYGAGYSSNYDTLGFLYFDVNGDGIKDLVAPTSEDASYGAKFDPNLMVYQWDAFGDTTSPYYKKARPWVAAQNDPSTFYKTSWSYNTSVFAFGGGDKATYKLGWTRNDDRGILPNSHVKRDNFNAGFNYTITEKLHATGNVNYSVMTGYGRAGTGYSGGNLNQNFRQWYQTNVDIQEQKDAFFRTGRNITWNWKDPSTAAGTVPIYTNNYYWTRYMNYETDNRNRVLGNLALNYQATDWLNFMGRITVDNYSALQEERVAVGSQAVSSYSRFDIRYNENNYDLMANVNKDLSELWNLSGTVGVNQRKTTYSTVFGQTNGGLVTPLVYALSNSAGTIDAPTETNQPIRVDGYYATATLTYDRAFTLDGAVRKDRFSTLPKENNSATYGGVSFGYIFTRHMKVPWISFGKIRMNYATAGNDAAWGATNFAYDKVGQFGSSLLYSMPSQKSNQNIQAELTKSKAVGLTMAFLKNRVSFDATYYYTNSLNQNIPLAVSTATGYSSLYLNGGNIRNTGIEVLLSGSPVKTRNFSWDITVNWTRNRNKVIELLDGADNLQLATSQGGVSINATKGQPYGTIQGRKINQLNGKDIIKANGYYDVSTTTNNVLGDYNPKWYGGVNNSFAFKNFALSFLVDVRKGSSVFSLDRYYGHMTGVAVESAGLNDLGNPVRNSLNDENPGGIILDGVLADGTVNTKRVTIDANSPAFPVSKFIYDAGFVKLREAVLSYNLPESIIRSIKGVQNVQFSVFGRNLWVIHKNVPYADPEETLSAGNVQGIQSGAYPTTRSIGVNLKVTF